MLSEMNQTQKEKHCMVTPTYNSKKVEYIALKSGMVVIRGGEGGMGRCCERVQCCSSVGEHH